MNPAILYFNVAPADNGFLVTVFLKNHESQTYVFSTEAKVKKFINNLFKKDEA